MVVGGGAGCDFLALEVSDDLFEHNAAGGDLLVATRSSGGDAKDADEWRKGEPLDDDGDEDGREGKEDDEVALGEGAAIAERGGKRERCGQSDDTAHAGPADEEDLAGILGVEFLMEQ